MTASVVTIQAPAKINLGLDILGKRPDGYHEIRTVMAMLELADTLYFSTDPSALPSQLDGVPEDENLVSRAISAFRGYVPNSPEVSWNIAKRIPSAAGLGGASSDAAATLLAMNVLSGTPLSHSELSKVAATLGSDIPFFLGTSFALSTGRGTDLAPLPGIALDVLLIVPGFEIPRKTATLYSLISSGDYSSGEHSRAAEKAIVEGQPLATGELGNAFSRALTLAAPDIDPITQMLRGLPCNSWGLSGAGPTHYVMAPSSQHSELSSGFAERFGPGVFTISTRTRLEPPELKIGSTGG
jgi:4-diphosphocytidyl-2-C-methyl-D-erythritol kinase